MYIWALTVFRVAVESAWNWLDVVVVFASLIFQIRYLFAPMPLRYCLP